MNIYFIQDEDGITQFDAGTQPMTDDTRAEATKLGGLKRIVLGHSHSDHRGTAPALGVPVYCHPDEVPYATTDEGGIPAYWDMDDIDWWFSRFLYKRFLHSRWDAGAVKIADTIDEGDAIAGFKVVHLPGHAPGLIGLWRESDRLMLSSDAIYLVDSIRLKALPEDEAPTVPHRIWNWDTEAAAESVRKLATFEPRTIATGHEHVMRGEPAELRARLERAADRV